MPLQKRLDQASALLVCSSTFSNEPPGGRVLGSSKVVLAENKRSRLSLSATPPPPLLPPPLLCLPYCSSGETSAPAGVVTAEVFWWERSMMGDVHRGMCVLGPRWPLSAALLPVYPRPCLAFWSCVAAVFFDTLQSGCSQLLSYFIPQV